MKIFKWKELFIGLSLLDTFADSPNFASYQQQLYPPKSQLFSLPSAYKAFFCLLLPLSLSQCKLLVFLISISKQATLTLTITVTEPIPRYSSFQYDPGGC